MEFAFSLDHVLDCPCLPNVRCLPSFLAEHRGTDPKDWLASPEGHRSASPGTQVAGFVKERQRASVEAQRSRLPRGSPKCELRGSVCGLPRGVPKLMSASTLDNTPIHAEDVASLLELGGVF